VSLRTITHDARYCFNKIIHYALHIDFRDNLHECCTFVWTSAVKVMPVVRAFLSGVIETLEALLAAVLPFPSEHWVLAKARFLAPALGLILIRQACRRSPVIWSVLGVYTPHIKLQQAQHVLASRKIPFASKDQVLARASFITSPLGLIIIKHACRPMPALFKEYPVHRLVLCHRLMQKTVEQCFCTCAMAEHDSWGRCYINTNLLTCVSHPFLMSSAT